MTKPMFVISLLLSAGALQAVPVLVAPGGVKRGSPSVIRPSQINPAPTMAPAPRRNDPVSQPTPMTPTDPLPSVGNDTPRLPIVATGSCTDSALVFGPIRYESLSSGAQTDFLDTIAVQVVPGRRYLVEVTNSGLATMIVSLNGVEAIGVDELGGTPIKKVVTVFASNTLEIHLTGTLGTYAYLRVMQVPESTYTIASHTFTKTVSSTITWIFSPPGGSPAPYTMHVRNGGDDGFQRMDHATIKLNRVQIVSGSELTDGVATLSRTVTLNALDTMVVTATLSDIASYITVAIAATDTTPPDLTVTAPANGDTIDAFKALCTGTVVDAQTWEGLEINGQTVALGGGGAFSDSIPLPHEGPDTLQFTARNGGCQTTVATRTVFRDALAPTLTIAWPHNGHQTTADTVFVLGTWVDVTATDVTIEGILPGTGFASANSFGGTFPLRLGPNLIKVRAIDRVGHVTDSTRVVFRESPGEPGIRDSVIVPDVAVDPTIPRHFHGTTKFLYLDKDPVQTDADPEAISEVRAAVIRGQVFSVLGLPMANVVVSVLGHEEYGSTRTRSDGRYDLAVNGEGPVTLAFAKPGFIAAQRRVNVPLRDFIIADPVTLIQVDPNVTEIDFVDSMAVAVGSLQSDANGTRQTALMFERATSTWFLRSDGSTEAITDPIHVRATEYTVGPAGQQAMPAELPPGSGYTYCVELSIDELAEATDPQTIRRVEFSKQVAVYVENYRGFPVGLPIPAGTYDRTTGLWYPIKNGRVILVTAAPSGGEAAIDVTGDSLADPSEDLDAIGLDRQERLQLAARYDEGTSLWRIAVDHFSPLDGNFPCGPPEGAREPTTLIPTVEGKDACTHMRGGSVIECENQVFGEDVPILGTPYALHYRSDRTHGYRAGRQLRIPLTDGSEPVQMLHTEALIYVAGQRHEFRFAPTVRETTFIWDGHDCYNRPWQGDVFAHVWVTHVYPRQYFVPADEAMAFGLPCGGSESLPDGFKACALPDTLGLITEPYKFRGRHRTRMMRYLPEDLGGWTLSPHHVYDTHGDGTLFLGTGGQGVGGQLHPTIDYFAGTTAIGDDGDEGPALEAMVDHPEAIAVGRKGEVFVADTENHRVRRVDSDGTITAFAGTGTSGAGAEDVSATLSALSSPRGLCVGPDGSVYIADSGNNRVRRVDPEGLIATVAGDTLGGSGGFSGDGSSARGARLSGPTGVGLASDGAVLIADQGNHRLRRVSTIGTIQTIAGDGSAESDGDGGAAAEASLHGPYGVVEGLDQEIFVSEELSHRIRRIERSGLISTSVGTSAGYSGDGGFASEAAIQGPRHLAVGMDGILYIADAINEVIRAVDSDGIIHTVAGSGLGGIGRALPNVLDDSGPHEVVARGAATLQNLNNPSGVAVTSDRRLFIADTDSSNVRLVHPVLPTFTLSDIAVAAGDGAAIYRFDYRGRHLATVDSRSGVTTLSFGYNSDNKLATITDRDGNATTVTYATGHPQSIISPHGGTVTTLGTHAGSGLLSSVVDPVGNEVSLLYDDGGLLTTVTDRRENEWHIAYDGLGRLTREEDPLAATVDLTRVAESDTHRTVRHETAEGVQVAYSLSNHRSGNEVRTRTVVPDLSTVSLRGLDEWSQITSPDSTRRSLRIGPDPRFGLQVPVATQASVRFLDGPTSRVDRNTDSLILSKTGQVVAQTIRSTVFKNNPSSFVTFFERWLNNESDTTIKVMTPKRRETTTYFDGLGRLRTVAVDGLDPIDYRYNDAGLITASQQGGRLWQYTYDESLRIRQITDPEGRVAQFVHDAADRVVKQTMPDGTIVSFRYDPNGHLEAIKPSDRALHEFQYTAVDRIDSYSPPSAGLGTSATTYEYNDDRQVRVVHRPDAIDVVLDYDGMGRIATISQPGGDFEYDHDPVSGQLTGLLSPDGVSLAYTYAGPLILSETWGGPVVGAVRHTYNDRVLTATQTVIYGKDVPSQVDFTYDDDGQLLSVGALSIPESDGRYSGSGLLRKTELGSITTDQGINGAGELISYSARFNTDLLFETTCVRDSIGRIATLTETVADSSHDYTYTYTTAGRLSEVVKDGLLVGHYEYDAVGNDTLLYAPAGNTIEAEYDAQDRLSQYGATTMLYTANGDLSATVTGVDTTLYIHDAMGNLTNIRMPDDTHIEYIIDGRQRRVGRKVDDDLQATWLYQDATRIVAELDAAGNLTKRFVFGTKGNVPEYMVTVPDDSTYSLITDQLGSVRLVVNSESGYVAQRIRYGPWGEVQEDSNPGFQPFGYAGGLYDSEASLVRFGARDYDPRIARWIRKDPSRFAGGALNLFEYCMSDPINNVDPAGKFTVSVGVVGSLSSPLGWGGGGGTYLNFGYDKCAGLTFSLTGAVEGGVSPGLGGGLGFDLIATNARDVNDLLGTTHQAAVGPAVLRNMPIAVGGISMANGVRGGTLSISPSRIGGLASAFGVFVTPVNGVSTSSAMLQYSSSRGLEIGVASNGVLFGGGGTGTAEPCSCK